MLKEAVPAIWPLGHGTVLICHAVQGGKALFFLRAVRDELVGKAGETASLELWEALEDAPTLTLAFADADALDRCIASLEELRADLAVASEATQ